jgi:uncharacterized protein YdaU (DUF1376 family)
MNWYPRYPGDYMRDTAHLSLVQHGVYNVLLDHYYATGGPLPDSANDLIRICRAFTPEEQQAVKIIADQFFPINGDGLRHNKRADNELAKSAEKSQKARASIEKRWLYERNTNEHTNVSKTNIPSLYSPQPQPQPHPDTKKEKHGSGAFGNAQKVGAGKIVTSNSQDTHSQADVPDTEAPDPQFTRCWEAFEKYGVKKIALKYWRKYSKADRAKIEAAIPDYNEAVRAGRPRKQFEGWINPEHRLWDMDWIKAAEVAREKNAPPKLVNTFHQKTKDKSLLAF